VGSPKHGGHALIQNSAERHAVGRP
jgi:hypothetical protein